MLLVFGGPSFLFEYLVPRTFLVVEGLLFSLGLICLPLTLDLQKFHLDLK